MHTHEISSSQKNRSAADAHKGNGASLPAAQLYHKQNVLGVLHRISGSGNMAVKDSGNPDYFFANGNAQKAGNVLNELGDGPEETKKYGINIAYVNNCILYANQLLQRIHNVDLQTQETYKLTKNSTSENKEVPPNPVKLFEQEVSGNARPDLGEVYFAVNDPSDPEFGKKHFNFHWATVVAQDGSDVITAEAAPNAGKEWFQMYNHANENQTFEQHYIVDLPKLAETAKVFALSYHQRQKPTKAVYDIIDSDEENKDEVL